MVLQGVYFCFFTNSLTSFLDADFSWEYIWGGKELPCCRQSLTRCLAQESNGWYNFECHPDPTSYEMCDAPSVTSACIASPLKGKCLEE